MSYFELLTPQDMLQKAKREHARLKADCNIDNVFNFFVTASHIRDYIEVTNAVSKADTKELFTDQDMKDCRDLCDKAKHLKLTKRPDPSTRWLQGTYGGAPFASVPYGQINGAWELWNDGRVVNIESLTDRIMDKWESFFQLHKL